MAILLVDDDAAIRRLLRGRLELYRAGEIHDAEDGTAALELLERQPVDGVILDLMMPGMDGTELARRIRARDVGEPMPLMVMSAVADRDRLAELQSMQISDYLLKPINPVLAGRRIQAFLDHTRDHRRGKR